MPKNKNFQIRIEILDELLNSSRRRNIEELLYALNERLEDSGDKPIAKRSLYDDLAYLENSKGAPIKRSTKADPSIYYTEKFSIKNVPIDEEDVSYLRQAIDILKKATDLNIIKDVELIVTKLENKVHTNVPDRTTMIAFEEHTQATGQDHIDPLFTAIRQRCTLSITYAPFKKDPYQMTIHPYLLKEFRNRWFLICRKEDDDRITNLALDRIKKIGNCKSTFTENNLFDPDKYFHNLIGVTVPDGEEISDIVIRVKEEQVLYILTKPIHHTQEKICEYSDGSIDIKLRLINNYELRSILLSYGPGIVVVAPERLRQQLKDIFQNAFSLYKDACK